MGFATYSLYLITASLFIVIHANAKLPAENSCGICKCEKNLEKNVLIVNCSDISNPNGTVPDPGFENCYGAIDSVADFRRAEIIKITDIKICGVTNVTMAENRITKIPNESFSAQDSLRHLSLRNNTIIDIEPRGFRGLDKLEYLDISHNLIGKKGFRSDIFTRLTRLKILKINSNAISSIDEKCFSNLKELQFLDISNNALVHLSPSLFENLSRLRYLSLAFNSVENITSLHFKYLLELATVDLSHNKLTNLADVFVNNNMLTTLQVSNNYIRNLTSFPNSIEYIHLSHNPIFNVEKSLYSLSSLTELHMENTTATTLDGFSSFHTIKVINASFNKIEQFQKNNFEVLRLLDLSSNLIDSASENITANSMPLLEELYLDSNPIRALKISKDGPFNYLRILSLNHNPEMTELQSGTFSNVSKTAMDIRLSHNVNLRTISLGAFKDAIIKKIDLSGNELESVPHNLFKWAELDMINLQDNPWNCDCSLQWMLDEVVTTMYKKDSSVLNELRCKTPEYLRDRRMVHYYNWTYAVFCTEFERMRTLDTDTEEQPTIGTSLTTIIIIVSVAVALILMIALGVYLQRRRRERIRARNRRF